MMCFRCRQAAETRKPMRVGALEAYFCYSCVDDLYIWLNGGGYVVEYEEHDPFNRGGAD